MNGSKLAPASACADSRDGQLRAAAEHIINLPGVIKDNASNIYQNRDEIKRAAELSVQFPGTLRKALGDDGAATQPQAAAKPPVPGKSTTINIKRPESARLPQILPGFEHGPFQPDPKNPNILNYNPEPSYYSDYKSEIAKNPGMTTAEKKKRIDKVFPENYTIGPKWYDLAFPGTIFGKGKK